MIPLRVRPSTAQFAQLPVAFALARLTILAVCFILYAPDYVINAGGLINVCTEIEENGYNYHKPVLIPYDTPNSTYKVIYALGRV